MTYAKFQGMKPEDMAADAQGNLWMGTVRGSTHFGIAG